MNKNLFRRMCGLFGKSANKSASDQKSAVRIEFELTYKQFPIGVLAFQNSVWEWTYSDRFRAQDKLVPLIEFPDVNRVYRTEELWPFFATRAPSLKRPDILQIIERERIDKNDEVALLKRFGQRTVANPFELVSA